MIDASKVGTDWQDDELDAIVADYFAMLAMDAAGEPFVKAHRAKALERLTGRSHKSVEFKHMNISAVAAELGLPTVRGYRALSNYQAALFPAIDRYLTRHDAWTIGDENLKPVSRPASPNPGLGEASAPFSSPFHGEGDHEVVEGAPPLLQPLIFEPPPDLRDAAARPVPLQRLIRKFDPAARDARNRALGLSGEEQVYRSERARLFAADRPDLARKIEWTSQERGDGAGYDIRSFAPDGAERFIEVKTTRGGSRTDFFLSRNERAFSEEEPERYRLYRLYDASAALKLFELRPPLEKSVRLEAETWRAGFS